MTAMSPRDGTIEDFVMPKSDDRPDIQVTTVGDNLVLATALHSRDEAVDIGRTRRPTTSRRTAARPRAKPSGVLEQISLAEGPTSPALRAGLGASAELSRKVGRGLPRARGIAHHVLRGVVPRRRRTELGAESVDLLVDPQRAEP